MVMDWINLENKTQIDDIKKNGGYYIIFKHSTRCAISSMAKRSFEASWDDLPNDITLLFLDLLQHRDLSSYVADVFDVHHESPQMILIKDGKCILDASHGDISVDEILEVIKN